MNRVYSLIIILSMFIFPLSGSGEEKPSITVNFTIKEQTYINYFGAEKIKWIETEARKIITDLLTNYFSFLEFTDIEKEDKLIITLKPKDKITPTTKVTDVLFQFTVEGQNISNNVEPVFWTFKPDVVYNVPLEVDKEEFRDEIIIRFEILLDNRDSLMDQLFSKVVIAREAQHLPNSFYFDMPFHLGIGQESKFKLYADVKSVIDRSLPFEAAHMGFPSEGTIRTEMKKPENEIKKIKEEMKSHTVEIIINRIYVIFYKPAEEKTIKSKKSERSTPDEEKEV